ncbi:MAG: arylesterase [Bacteroidetes bacterium]|nr:arylesterase [Bacteroidota bacterium]
MLACLLPQCTPASDRGNRDNEGSKREAHTRAPSKRRILFFGDSLTAGYGLENPADGFVARIAQRLDSLGWDWEVVNAGLSGETSAGGDGRIDWVLQQPVDLFILELGANDGLRGIPVEETAQNLQSILEKVRKAYPQATCVMAGMEAPPNMGADFTGRFRALFPTLARKNNMPLIPFLLAGVAGEPALNQPDGIHPTAEGHRLVAENVWRVLRRLLAPA